MDPLQELWDLWEAQAPLQAAPTPFVGTPENDKFDNEHPVTQQRRAVDTLRLQGMKAGEAHENVFGDVDLSNTDAKRDLSSTMGRVQDDGNRKAVRIDMDADFPSIMANDNKITAMTNQTTVSDIRTPMNKQIPDMLQDPNDGAAPVEQQEEMDYNWDVAYLQKYGRA